nr:MAG TPA: hypothetical protein [Caudoviricetes sp.]
MPCITPAPSIVFSLFSFYLFFFISLSLKFSIVYLNLQESIDLYRLLTESRLSFPLSFRWK